MAAASTTWLEQIPSSRTRALLAFAIGLASAGFVALLYARQAPGTGSDFDQCWIAARALLAGRSPYRAVVDAGWPWPLYYPLPAVLLAVPLAWLPLDAARAVFVGLGAGTLAFALSGRGWWGLTMLTGAAFLDALVTAQWTPIVTAAALVPALGVVLAGKPTSGGAVWAAYPNRVSGLLAAGLVMISFAAYPGWLAEWLAALKGAHHLRSPVLRPGGVLLLLAIARWRLPEGRLLSILAIAPQGAMLYESVPMFLAPRSFGEAAVVTLLGDVAFAMSRALAPGMNMAQANSARWPILLLLVYLPMLTIVLWRRSPLKPSLPPRDARRPGTQGGLSS